MPPYSSGNGRPNSPISAIPATIALEQRAETDALQRRLDQRRYDRAGYSVYYNEFFSIPMSLFGAGKWACPTDPALTSPSRMRFDRALCPAAFSQGLARITRGSGRHSKRPLTYGAGVDPAWHGARTELQFLNSVKMKMSIVLGVVQMNAGIAMSLLNQRSERDRLSSAPGANSSSE